MGLDYFNVGHYAGIGSIDGDDGDQQIDPVGEERTGGHNSQHRG